MKLFAKVHPVKASPKVAEREFSLPLPKQYQEFSAFSSKTVGSPDTNFNDSKEDQYPHVQLHQKNKSTISQVNETVTSAGENVQSKRIASLERQLELALEMSPNKDAHRGNILSRSGHPKKNDQPNPVNESIEISAMQELLSRVIAEKNRLEIHNENLKLLVAQDRSAADVEPLPSTIDELDGLLQATELSNHCERQTKEPDQQISMLYRMTCRRKNDDGLRVRYLGVYTTNSTKKTEHMKALARAVDAHFSQVWDMIDKKDSSELECGFAGSSLAEYLAHTCKEFFNREGIQLCQRGVTEWCRDNVKVEIPNGRQ